MGMHRAGWLELDFQLKPGGPTTAGSMEVCIDKQMGPEQGKNWDSETQFPTLLRADVLNKYSSSSSLFLHAYS